MEIKTKLNLDECCYLIDENRIKKGHVEKIEVTVKRNSYLNIIKVIYYTVNYGNTFEEFEEDKIFRNVDEALEFLKDNVII